MRNAFLPLMLAGLLVAGCTAPAAPTTTTTGPPTTTEDVRQLPAELVVPTVTPALLLGASAGEPNIAVAPDGTIYVTPVTNLFRSTDGGKTFTDLGTDKTDGHGDGDIAVDSTGRLHWLGLFGDAGPIPYQSSDDQGESFSDGLDLSSKTGKSTDGTGSDREWLDARPDGTVYASWRDADDSGIIAARTSLDGGLTWQERTTMAPDAIGGPIVHGPRVGSVYEAMTTLADSPTGGAKVLLARSGDDGATWNLTTVLDPSQSVQFGLIGFPTSIFPVAAVDDNGTVYVVFAMDQQLVPAATPKPAARFSIFLSVSHDDGMTWQAPRRLSDPNHAAVMPFVAAGAAGRIAVTWYENTAGLPNDALPDLWNVMLYESIDADGAGADAVTVQLNDLPSHIGSICTSGTGCLFGGDRSLLDFFEVALDNDGQPVVAWASSNGGTVFGGIPSTDIYFGTVKGTPLR